jgi:hypothetical protein
MRVTIQHLALKGTIAAIALAGIAVSQAAAADECRDAVEAAFEKQRTFATGYRFSAQIPGDQGETRMTIDYLPPDRMYQKVEAPGHGKPVETIAIQRWAWGTMGGGWEELQPQFAQSIIAHVRSTLIAPPKITAQFTCLGRIALGGKEFLAYRADQPSTEAGSTPDNPRLARTIYVDESSGLPVANIVAHLDGKDGAVFDGHYNYPTDIRIEPPVGGRDIGPPPDATGK